MLYSDAMGGGMGGGNMRGSQNSAAMADGTSNDNLAKLKQLQ